MRLIAFLSVLFLTGSLSAQDIVHFSGKIDFPLCDSVELSYNDNYLAYYPQHFVARLDKKGNFSTKFSVPHGVYTQVEVRHGNRLADVLMRAGDSLFLTVNAKFFDSTVHYAGKGAGIQNFIAKHTLDRGRMNQYTLKVKNLIGKEPDDFIKGIEDEYNAEMKYLGSSKEKFPESFVGYWKAFYKYYNYFFIEQYPQTHEMIKVRRYTDTIPDANYVVIKSMKLAFHDSLLQVPSYLLYLTGVFEAKMRADGYTWIGRDTLKMQEQEDSVYKLAYKTLPGKSAEYFMAQNLYGRAKSQRLARTELQFAVFKKHWPESGYMPLLQKQVSMAEKLAPGQPAPDFDIWTPDGKHKKLWDMKGKVVYLDFWAVWCKQCVGEMISSRKLKEMIIKEPVEFVYASLDTDTATQRMITHKYKIEGTFTSLADSWNSKEVEDYGVQGLPAYFLIDTEGKFALQYTPSPTQAIVMLLEIEKLIKRKD